MYDIPNKIQPSFEKRGELVEEVRKERKLISYYNIKPDVSFNVYDDGYMEMEYRGEKPTDLEDPGFSIRREVILPNTERYNEILEITNDMMLEPNIYGELIPEYEKRFPKSYITKEMYKKLEKYMNY